MSKLTLNQQEAVKSREKDICVVASAGTGKTSVLVERYLDLVLRRKVDPSNILTLTFTKKASNEMRDRIIRAFDLRDKYYLREKAEESFIGTIDSFAARILRENVFRLDLNPDFNVCDEIISSIDKKKSIKKVCDEYVRNNKEAEVKLMEYFGDQFVDTIYHIYEKLDRLAIRNYHNLNLPSEKYILKNLTSRLKEVIKSAGCIENIVVDGWYENLIVDIEKCDVDTSPENIWRIQRNMEKVKLTKKRKGLEDYKGEFKSLFQTIYEVFSVQLIQVAGGIGIFQSIFTHINQEYEKIKAEKNVIDFPDLLFYFQKLCTAHPDLTDILCEKYRYILIDEYQDTNKIQSKLIKEFIKNSGTHFFVVGDKKQSIYGFRDAQVDEIINYEKKLSQLKEGEVFRLDQNFRSRKELVEFFNLFFQFLWRDESHFYDSLSSDITSEKLTCNYPVDVMLLEGGEKKISASLRRESEAIQMALKIRDIIENKKIYVRTAENNIRYIEYQDVAILFRSLSNIKIYERIFNQYQIPYYLMAGKGFYKKREIEDIFHFFKVLQNPYDDFSFLALMRSPIYGLSMDGVYLIKDKLKSDFVLQLSKGEKIKGLSDGDREAIRQFSLFFQNMYQSKYRLTVYQLVKKIISETDLIAKYLVRMDFDSRQTYANIKKLEREAMEFEKRHRFGIDEFIEYYQDVKSEDSRIGEAATQSEKSNVVRMMTIHASKGLEFPCVIIADLEKDEKTHAESIMVSNKGDVGCKVFNPLTGNRYATKGYNRIKSDTEDKDRREENRLFYVAMTRAKDKLILSGIKKETFNGSRKSNRENWATKVARVLGGIKKENPDAYRTLISEEIFKIKANEKRKSNTGKNLSNNNFDNLTLRDKERVAKKYDEISNSRRFHASESIALSVTELSDALVCPMRYKWRILNHIPENNRTPNIILNKTDAPDRMQIGNVVHACLEKIHFKDGFFQKSAKEYIQNTDMLTSKEKKISFNIINKFYKSELFNQIVAGKKHYRELPFTMKIGGVKLRGTIDTVYEDEKGSYAILDYKTHNLRKKDVEKEAIKSQNQILIYAFAYWRLTGVIPKKASLYYMTPEVEYTVKITEKKLSKLENQILSLGQQLMNNKFEARCEKSHIDCAYKDMC